MAWGLALQHLGAALLPALALAALLPVLAALLLRSKKAKSRTLLAQAALIFVACLGAQGLAWLVWGSDARMAAYITLVLAAGSAQVWALRGV